MARSLTRKFLINNLVIFVTKKNPKNLKNLITPLIKFGIFLDN